MHWKTSMKRTLLGAAFACFAITALANPTLQSNGMLTSNDGRTLYVFDKDQPGKSHCTGGCATTWPAFKVENAALEGGLFTIVRRDDGVTQWAYNGKPLYFFAGDAAPGDAKGDKQGGVWHVVRHGTRAAQDSAPSYNVGY